MSIAMVSPAAVVATAAAIIVMVVVVVVVVVVVIGERVAEGSCGDGSSNSHGGIDRLHWAAIFVIGGHAAHAGSGDQDQ